MKAANGQLNCFRIGRVSWSVGQLQLEGTLPRPEDPGGTQSTKGSRVDGASAFGKFKLFREGSAARWLSVVKGALSRGGGAIKGGAKPVAMSANR